MANRQERFMKNITFQLNILVSGFMSYYQWGGYSPKEWLF